MMKLFKSTARAKAGRNGASGEAAPANADVRLTIVSNLDLLLHTYKQSFAMATVSEVPDEPGQPPALTALSLAETSQDTKTKEQIITPFDVSGGVDEHGKAVAIDYDKLIDHFGSQRIDKAMLERFEKLTGKPPHRLLRRGLVFSHRDLNRILDDYQKDIPFFLYTGRGPSSGSMHVGHSVPFEFTKSVGTPFPSCTGR